MTIGTRTLLTTTFDHSSVGPITVDCDTLAVNDPDQFLTLHTAAPGSPDADELTLLRMLGTRVTSDCLVRSMWG